MEPYRLEVPYVTGEGPRTILFLIAGAIVVGGVLAAVGVASMKPLLAVAIGVAMFVALLNRHPTYQHINVLTVDAEGIWFLRDVRPGGVASKFRWQEVKAVSMRIASNGDDPQGIEITTTRFGPKGVPVLVPINDEQECNAAFAAAQWFIGRHAHSAA